MLRFTKLDGCGHPRRIWTTQIPNRTQYVFLVASLLLPTNAVGLFLGIFGGNGPACPDGQSGLFLMPQTEHDRRIHPSRPWASLSSLEPQVG